MKKILKRGLYIMKAKGRHGTHSPFVYTFVEQVLRAKTKFNLKENPLSLSLKEISLLGRALLYINPCIVYVEDTLKSFLLQLKASDKSFNFEIRLMDMTPKKQTEDALFFCFPTKENVAFLKSAAAFQSMAAILLHQHTDREKFENWELLEQEDRFTMVMDVWNFGFVSNHPDFKIKQFFRLR
jgi:hypothetical protein